MISNKFSLSKGILIAIEGIDGAGKTTQVENIKTYFQKNGLKVSTFKEPTDGKYGKKIRNLAIHGRHSVSSEEEMELFINDRIEDCEINIKPALKKKHLVIMDRYYFSNMAYQSALGIDIDHIRSRNEEIAITPDMVIILDLAVHIGLSRIINYRNDQHNHFENEDYLEKVRKIFNKMTGSKVQGIPASPSEQTVLKNIKNILRDIVGPYLTLEQNQTGMFKNIYGRESAVEALFN